MDAIATLMFTRGLQRIGDQASQTSTGYSVSRQIQVMSVDDGTVAFAAANNSLTDSGSPTNEFDNAFDASPTRASQTVSHAMTLQTGDFNQVVKRIALHDDTATNVTKTSNTLVCGIDALSLTKASTFTLKSTVQITYS